MTNLHSVSIGQNRFCGPAVLSALTGKNTDECAKVISQINGQYTVVGVTDVDLLKAADRLGFTNRKIEITGSLYRVLSSIVYESGIYIIMVPHHFIAIEVKEKQIYLVDNHTKEPISASNSARLMQNVDRIYKVYEKPKPVLLSDEIVIDKYKTTSSIEISVYRQQVYDVSQYNTVRSLGRFTVKDEKEYREVLKKLME